MAHVRKQIRDAVVAKVMGLATTGTRVHHGRTRPLGEGHDPTLLVYAIEEKDSIAASGEPPTQERELTIAIEGRVIGADTPDDKLDLIASEVETAIGASQKLNGLILGMTLMSTRINTQAPGQSQAGEVRMEFAVLYRTREGAPDTAV